MKTSRKPPELKVGITEQDKDFSQAEAMAKYAATVPTMHALSGVQAWQKHVIAGDVNLMVLLGKIEAQTAAMQRGELSDLEAMLFGQALVLQSTFSALSQRAAGNFGENIQAVDLYMRLALKAQSQCCRTLEALAEIKNPRSVVFAKQFNNAQGHQQVNNHTGQPPDETPAAREKTAIPPNELLSDERVPHAKPMDAGTKSKAGKCNPRVEAVGEGHRATHGAG